MIDELIYGAVGLLAYKLASKKTPTPGPAATPATPPPAVSSLPPARPPISSYEPPVASEPEGDRGRRSGVSGAVAGAGPGAGPFTRAGGGQMSKTEINARSAATPERIARIKAAWQGREIPGLNHVAFALFIAGKESGNNYRPFLQEAKDKGYPLGMNQIGFSGMYQAGAEALEDAGFIKPGRSNSSKKINPSYPGMAKVLLNPSNWTDLCPGGLEQYLNSPELQELSFAKFTNKNKRYIASILTQGMPSADLAGYLAAAQLTGHTGAKALAIGKTRKDANGATNALYYRIGAASQLA